MKLIYLIILVFLVGLTQAIPDFAIAKYNDTCIETVNWQYVFVVNGPFVGHCPTEVELIEVQQIGPKSVLADVY